MAPRKTRCFFPEQLTEHDALAAHVRDELGITELSQAKPLQAALASGASFTVGGILPLLISIFMPLKYMVYLQYGLAIAFLILLGTIAAKTGGSSVSKAAIRITLWGTIAMAISAGVGYVFGVAV